MMVMKDKVDCCGCGACAQICPMHCIEMREDREGFKYPVIDRSRCIVCNACDKVCPIKKYSESKSLEQCKIKAYGGWNKNEEIRSKSSSGGAFSLFAEAVINAGGRVYGAALNEKNEAIHIGVDSLSELQILRGSKYVQCNTGQTYVEIKKLLEEGKRILFVGTPCQAAGLHTFLGNKKYHNLNVVDFICHGVPSPKLFRDYISKLEQEHGGRIVEYRFRNKDRGWNQTGLQLGTYYKFEDGTEVRNYPAFKDVFMNAFLDDVALRPSCYRCTFKSIPKDYADITIADFWGVNKINRKLNDKKGTSLILVNTEKGMELWNEVSENFKYEEVNVDTSISKNFPLLKSARLFPRREKFFRDYSAEGYAYVEKKYMTAFQWGIHKITSLIISLWCKLNQFIKFGIVGVSNTVVNLLVYYICISFGTHYLLAYTIGFLASVGNAFFWNNKFVFKNKEENSIPRAFLKVLASYSFSFFLSVILMSIMVELLYISSVMAPILKLVITVPINFMLNKLWAFKDKK